MRAVFLARAKIQHTQYEYKIPNTGIKYNINIRALPDIHTQCRRANVYISGKASLRVPVLYTHVHIHINNILLVCKYAYNASITIHNLT